MCCLNFENQTYQDLRKGMPNDGERIMTPDGLGKVVNVDLFNGKVDVRLITKEKDEEKEEREVLSSDVSTYFKQEIRRLEKKNNNTKKGKGKGSRRHSRSNNDSDTEGLDAETLRELEALTKD